MKPWDKVSSFRGANTLLQEQQINGETGRRETTEGDPRTDQRRLDHRRSKDQSRGTRTAPRYNVRGSEYIVKRDCNDD
jgi:hypothetical protein